MKNLTTLLFIILLISCDQQTPAKQSVQIDYASIKTTLDSIHVEDQQYRGQLDSISSKFGWQSEEINKLWGIINKIDSSNLIVVEEILDNYGWLGTDKIGTTANSTLFLVIQHSNPEVQERYLPMMQKAVKNGDAKARKLALLEDRLNLSKGQLQVYGSQVAKDKDTEEMYVLPLFEPEHVNKRRATVGLGTIEEYIKLWNMDWDVDEYKKKLPHWIEKMNKQ